MPEDNPIVITFPTGTRYHASYEPPVGGPRSQCGLTRRNQVVLDLAAALQFGLKPCGHCYA